MLLLGIAATALYWPGVINAAMLPRWAILAAVVPWLVTRIRLEAPQAILAAFVLWAALSIVWSPLPLDGIGALFVLAVLYAAFLCGAGARSLRPLWIGAAVGVTISSVFTLFEVAGHPLVQTLYPGATGLYVNGNYMAEAAAVVVVALVAERLWWLIPGVLPALVLPQARGALLAVGVAMLCLLRGWKRWAAVAAALAAIGVYSALKGDASSVERLTIWHSTWNGLSLFGHGLGSFWVTYPHFDLRINPVGMPETAHNEWLTYGLETGLVGVLLFTAFCASLAGPTDTARLVLIAVLVEAVFAFPLHMPTTGFLAFAAAGYCVRSRFVLRDYAGFVGRVRAAWLRRAGLQEIHAALAASPAYQPVRAPVPRLSGAASLRGAP